ncbi:hypothetical protein LCGC14_1164180 [marine sediment metagenome]|uniref:ABC transporter domain-containing protein n=1 Tax=marine sediment metagenome TaxID=412755 RepID=A0A0F9LRS3_9ZZZZ
MNLSHLKPIPAGALVFVTGPSGSGKTQALSIISDLLPPGGQLAQPSIDLNRPLIDGWNIGPKEAIQRLTAVGLGDPVTWVRTPGELSVGQAQRLALADLLASDGNVIIIDEFLAGLDRLTAKAVAWTTQRAIRKAGKTAVLITANDDLIEDLAPEIVITCNWSPEPVIGTTDDPLPSSTISREISYRKGSTMDWLALKHLHYAAGNPATYHSIHCLDHPECEGPVAVMVLSYPDLHSAARNLATRGRYLTGNQNENAKRVNREVRRMSRIVVVPELRQTGLAARLIREAASKVDCRYIETSTAMGPFTSFCERAGFQSIPQERSRPEGDWVGFLIENSLPAITALSSIALAEWISKLSVRRTRTGRQLIWALYHHLVLHRRTRKKKPSRVPPADDPQWPDAFALAAVRATSRPTYYIMPIKHPESE